MGRIPRALMLLFAAGCAEASSFDGDASGPPFLPPPSFAEELTRIREDFNNRDLIGSETGDVVVDVNRGVVTLDAQMFPDFSGSGAVSAYEQPTHQNGLIEAQSIIIHEDGTLEASDSVELRAEDRVIVAGSLTVGRGGVTIIARQRIQIDGTIASEGPVRLLLADDTGTIQISGSISALSSIIGPSDISIHGRGAVLIDGQISTTGVPGAVGGDIDVYSYGDLTVTGVEAHLYTSASLDGGRAGEIDLQSESNLILESGAWLGGVPRDLDAESLEPGGDIELKATNVSIGDDVRVIATGATARGGGVVLATATSRLFTGHRAQIVAGSGPDGGSVIFKGGSIELGEATHVEGGSSSVQPGFVTMSAVESISMAPFSQIAGGSGECAPGGSVTVEVGGLLSAAEGAMIIGGSGLRTLACIRGFPGGAITIYARDAIGIERALVPGSGAGDGQVSVNLLADYSVPAPNLEVGTGGQIESRTIDRGEESISTIPRLVEIAAQVPADTEITVLLAGASEPEGPFDEWIPITSDANDKRFERFIGQRFVRYRVLLDGRKFDVPLLDYFEIDLAPSGY